MDEEAISHELLKQQYSGLFSLLRRRIKDPAVAEEMLNEAIMTAITHMRSGRIGRPDQIGGYIFRVAMNLYRNYCRQFDNRLELRSGDDCIDEIPSSERATDDAPDPKLAAQVQAIVASLPVARDREIIKRFYLDEEDKDSICTELGLSALQFDKVIFRARKRMQTLLEISGITKPDVLCLLVA